jgi:hypothetical protein
VADDIRATDRKPLFPVWLDIVVKVGGILVGVGALYVVALLYYGIHPQAMDIGYQPEQPVPYSHRVHAGELGIDCRYCHQPAEESAFATVPPTQTCMNCHTAIHAETETLAPVRQSHQTGLPVEWNRVHDLPDFVYFDHSAHVRRGVGCVECHGRVDRMDTVYQAKALSMAWCLDCHRNPEPRLRPLEEITNLAWTSEEDREALGRRLRQAYDIDPPTDCSTCHR